VKTALQIIQFIAYSSNTEISKVSSWNNVKQEAINGLNRAISVLWHSKEWNFRRSIKKQTLVNGRNTIGLGDYIIGENGVRINNTPLSYDKDIPFYDTKTGTPTKYYVTQGNIIVYPKPVKETKVIIETFRTLPVLSASSEAKESFSAHDDTINISERLEGLFINCLTYFCNEILNGDPTDEEYQEHVFRYAECYKLLEKADLGTIDNNSAKRFLMPWQQ